MTPHEALRVQEELRISLTLCRLPTRPRSVAGADVAYSTDMKHLCAAVVVLDLLTETVVDQATSIGPVTFPYIPGLLAFREGPALVEAFFHLVRMPDLLYLDGHGTFHPRAFGLASHLGVILDVPTIGCAKSRFLCSMPLPGMLRGSWTVKRLSSLQQTACVRTRDNTNPLYVSPGYKITLEESVEWVLRATRTYRIPEPLRRAHMLAKETLRNRA